MIRTIPLLCFAIFLIGANCVEGQSDNRVLQSADTIRIFYPTNESELDQQSLKTLDSAMKIYGPHQGIELAIFGYTDHLGSDEYNQTLSSLRAEKAKAWFLYHDFQQNQISSCVGKGKKGALETGDPFHRVVEIALTRKQEVPMERALTKAPDKIIAPKAVATEELINLKAGESLVLPGMHFLPGRHTLTESSIPSMAKLAKILKENPGLKIEIQGHICCQDVGDGYDYDSKDNNLSVNRAGYVYDYLLKNGIEKERLSYRGFGHLRPLVINEWTEADRDMNRRVEIKVLENTIK